MKWYGDIIIKAVEQRKERFLHEAGHQAQNQMSELAHKIEGVLRNSVNYKIYTGEWSGFQTEHGPETPPSDAEIDKPRKDYVRVGSNLVYAGPQEKHNAWASRSIDTIMTDGTLQRIADNVFKL